MSAAMTFQVARRGEQPALEPRVWARAEDPGLSLERGLAVLAVGAAVAPHVEHEQVEVRPAPDQPVHALGARPGATGAA